MASHKSAEKRARQNEKRRQRNRLIKSALKTKFKRVDIAINSKNANTAKEALRMATSALDKAASKGVIHRNTAARKKARLARKAASGII